MAEMEATYFEDYVHNFTKLVSVQLQTLILLTERSCQHSYVGLGTNAVIRMKIFCKSNYFSLRYKRIRAMFLIMLVVKVNTSRHKFSHYVWINVNMNCFLPSHHHKTKCGLKTLMQPIHYRKVQSSGGGHPGLPSLVSLVSVDVKQRFNYRKTSL